MLTTSANQYLHPDYLSPLPTTWSVRGRGSQPDILDPDLGHEPLQQQLDAKKSPLALLAQTCSQIGADSPSSKPLIPPLEKQPSSKSSSSSASTVKNDSSSSGSGGARDKSSPASSAGSDLSVKSSFKPYESSVSQQHHQQRDKTGSPQEDRAGASSGGGNGSARVRTPASTKSGGRCASNQSASSPRSSPVVGRKTPASAAAAAAAAAVAAASSAASDAKSSSESPLAATTKVGFSPVASSLLDPTASLKDMPLGTFKPTASYLGAFPHFPVDLMAAAAAAAGGGAAAHLKGSPYVSYARMKTPSGVDTLVPVCRDPYCTGCQLSSQLLAAAAASSTAGAGKGCPGGCAQCDHAGKAAFLPAAAAAAAYATAHAQLAALASHLPYVCNWIGSAAPSASSAADGSAAAAAAAAASGYCGKRFATSEELLQHLRSHTEAAVSPLFAHRAYPTPPLSPLATARYHPYGKPTPGALLPPGFPLHPHPGLPPYFSPYSLYGQRHP
ncbi:zinc finger protein Elbow-like isoform X1 [Schistocerca serialis cubense]|uniref:zinc finger protein Elbow-like isoform X1 n=1 Tax=Schistocerca serialis cubense TaxID=2023355 RepID=UPI00214EFCD9|nr:zinc finger protein Elbow-like isoform X1 [Schistocerca serialis cubense]